MLNVCRRIFSRLMASGVNYCHWKSNEHLKEGLNGKTDLDILVSDACAEQFSDILIECECIKVHPQFGSRYPKVDEWIGYDRETGKLIHLHVHFRMITGTKHLKEYMLPWHDLALKTKVLDESGTVYTIEPNLELIILYMRIVLKQPKPIGDMDKYELSASYRKEILWLKQRIDAESLSKLVVIIWKEEKERILSILLRKRPSKNDWAELQKIARDKVCIVRRGRILNNFKISVVRSKLIRIKYILKSKFSIVPFTALKTLYGRGCVFAFIGCDGSGKSRVTEEICRWLGWKLDCQNFYFGMGERYRKPFIYKILQSEWMPDTLRKAGSMLFYYHISVRCKYMRKLIDFYINNGGIAICDRYPQTQFKGIYDGPKIQAFGLYDKTALGRLFMRIEEKNIYDVANKKIDCVLKLVVPTDIALKRSPGHAVREVKRKAQITEKLQFVNCDVYEIDAMQPFEEEMLEIKGIIWDRLMKNHL